MSKEWVWFALPIIMLLSQLGGTFKKQYRRIGIPSLITLVALIFSGWSWWLGLVWVGIFIATTLPFTLIGDSIHSSWINWVWVWVWQGIICLSASALILAYGNASLYLYGSIMPFIVGGIVATLSNIKSKANFFPWKLCEAINWGFGLIPALLVISNYGG